MSKLRALTTFASWNFGAQALTVVLQFGYAAVTSRIVSDIQFGQYAVALAVAGLVTLLSNGGLGQAAGRMTRLDPARLSALTYYGAGLGVLGAIALVVSADWWAALWGVPEAAAAIRMLWLSVLLAPIAGLATGLLRRQGRFKALAHITLASNALGMAVGVVAVALRPSALSLLVSAIVAIVLQSLASLALNSAALLGRPRFRTARPDLAFSWKVMTTSTVMYLNGNLGKWAVGFGIGPASLGQWNRADVVSTIPLQQAHTAIRQAIYPEFRHDSGGPARAARVWTDMLALMAWLALPAVACIAAVSPSFVPIIFGEGWRLAAAIAPLLAIAAGLQVIAGTLSSAIEAISGFRLLAGGLAVSLSIFAAGAVVSVMTARFDGVLIALVVAPLAEHLFHLQWCFRNGYLDARRLWAGYGSALLFATAIYLPMWICTVVIEDPSLALVAALGALLLLAVVAFLCRTSLPGWTIARRYLDAQ